MSAQQDPIIIIVGGSVSLEFNPSLLLGSDGRFTNQDRQITRVEVTGDGINFAENIPGGSVTVRIYCDNA
jgi:hypothetical protein